MLDHMISPNPYSSGRDEDAVDGLNQSADQLVMDGELFDSNGTSTGSGVGVVKRSLVKRGLYTG